MIFITDDKGDLLNPMGTVEKNPNVDSAAGLLIRFHNIRQHPLYYPPLDKVFILKRYIRGRTEIWIYIKVSQKILICFQISDVEKNGDAPFATKEEVTLSTFHILQFSHSES